MNYYTKHKYHLTIVHFTAKGPLKKKACIIYLIGVVGRFVGGAVFLRFTLCFCFFSMVAYEQTTVLILMPAMFKT